MLRNLTNRCLRHRTAPMRNDHPLTDAELRELSTEAMNHFSARCIPMFERLIREREADRRELKRVRKDPDNKP